MFWQLLLSAQQPTCPQEEGTAKPWALCWKRGQEREYRGDRRYMAVTRKDPVSCFSDMAAMVGLSDQETRQVEEHV